MQTTRVRLPNGKFGSAKSNPKAPEAYFNTAGKPRKTRALKSKVTTAAPALPVKTGIHQDVQAIFVIDRSGSMQGWLRQVGEQWDAQVEKIRSLDTKENQTSRLSLIKFDSEVETVFEDARTDSVRQFSSYRIHHRGSTSLYDAVKAALKLSEKLQVTAGNGPVLITILTDGQENASRISATELNDLITKAQATDRYTIAFMVPPGHKHEIQRRLTSVPPGNIIEWDRTEQGIKDVGTATLRGLETTYNSYSKGIRNTKQFFEINANNLTDSALRSANLTDISNRVKFLTVDKENNVKTFIEDKVGSYNRGSAYYQLTKKETLRPGRLFLLQKRNGSEVYGGTEARKLLGVTTDSEEVRIEPGNLGDWIVYVQSESINRLLVRGSKLAYLLF
jgi:uncharacterized protein YegL